MKLTLKIMAIIVLIASIACAQRHDSGNRNESLSQNTDLPNFNKVILAGVFNVVLTPGNTNHIDITADEDVMEFIKYEVTDNTLKLWSKKMPKSFSRNNIKIVITYKKITDIDNSMVGNLSTNGALTFSSLDVVNSAVGNCRLELSGNSLSFKNSAVGNTTLTGKVNNANIKNSSVGNFDAEALNVSNMDINNSSVGNTVVNAEHISFNNSGVGKFTNRYGK